MTATRTLLIDANANDLSEVRFVDAFRDGTIVVAQPQDHKLKLYSSEGRLLKEVGRAGAGPGEFASLAGIHGFTGDTLWVLDLSLRRFTLIGSTGKIVRVASTPAAVSTDGSVGFPGSGLNYLDAVDPSGSLLLHFVVPKAFVRPPDWHDPQHQIVLAYVRVSPAGIFERLLSGRPDRYIKCGGSAPNLITECPWEVVGSGPDGRATVFVATDLEGPHAGTMLVTSLSARGDTVFQRRYPIEVLPIPQRTTDSTRAAIVSKAASPQIAAFWAKAKLPSVYRPVQYLFVGHDDTIWIRFHANDGGIPWLILDRNGVPLGQLTVPRDVSIQSGDKTTFWGRLTDADGLESAVRYRIGRP